MGRSSQKPREKPLYNVALGPAETTYVVPPPFTVPGVTARVFPLRASVNVLRSFCKNYLNVAPAEACELYPALPCVFLTVLDYGRAAPELTNLGWVSQHEVFFGVPLGMWRHGPQGRRTFVKWVLNTPFIAVDNAGSLTTGRETFGWPKILAELKYNPEGWLIDPRNPLQFLSLDVKGISDEEPNVRLLDIEQRLDQNPSLAPPDLGLIDPFERLSRLSRTFWSIGFDLAQLLLGAPLAGFDPRIVGDRPEVLSTSLRRLSSFYRQPGLSVVTLKQFRDAGAPTQICYQALVESRLSVARYNRGGFLGLYNLLQGDVTGGFRIRLNENPAFPILESLGLEVARERRSGGHTQVLLEPFFPFWMSVDLTYGKGKTLCWRMRGEPWYQGATQVSARPSRKDKAPYNTFAGGSQQVWYGPFLVPNAHFDVFPLKADRKQLYSFIRDYLRLEGPEGVNKVLANLFPSISKASNPSPPEVKLRPVGDHVYMIASSNRMFSKERSSAWIQSRQLAFCVPLLLTWTNGEQEFVIAMPFAFVDNPTLAMTMREVQGVPAMDATFVTPGRFWRSAKPLLTLQADVFTALDAGLRSQRRNLLEVVAGDSRALGSQSPITSKIQVTLSRLSLKQFRDAEEPDRACYQSLVWQPWTFSKPECTALDPGMAIRVYRYPSFPLVKTLGLRTLGIDVPQNMQGTIADKLVLESPFRIKSSIEIGLGAAPLHTASFLSWRLAPFHTVQGLEQEFNSLKQPKEIDILKLCKKRFGDDFDPEKDGLQRLFTDLFKPKEEAGKKGG